MAKDGWDITKIISGIISGFLVPIIIFIVGNQIANQQEKANEQRIQADRATTLLKNLASKDSTERTLAMAVIKYLAKNQQISSELVAAVEQILSAQNTKGSPAEDKITSETKSAAQAIQYFNESGKNPIEPSNQYWVYIGSRKKGSDTWETVFFSFPGQLSEKKELTAINDVYMRETKPSKRGDVWQKGKVIGVINAGDKVGIKELATIPGLRNLDLIWAKVFTIEASESLN